MNSAKTQPTQDGVTECADAAIVGLFGLAFKAMLADGGQPGALAALEKIATGQAFVRCEVIFNRAGATATGVYVSQGNPIGQNLFSVTQRAPSRQNLH